jgi:hypothetical protein
MEAWPMIDVGTLLSILFFVAIFAVCCAGLFLFNDTRLADRHHAIVADTKWEPRVRRESADVLREELAELRPGPDHQERTAQAVEDFLRGTPSAGSDRHDS